MNAFKKKGTSLKSSSLVEIDGQIVDGAWGSEHKKRKRSRGMDSNKARNN